MHPVLQPVQSVRLEDIHRPEPHSFAMFDMSTWSNLAIHVYTKIVPPGAERKTVLQAVHWNLQPWSLIIALQCFTWINKAKWQQILLPCLQCLHAFHCFPLPCNALPCLELKVLASTVAILAEWSGQKLIASAGKKIDELENMNGKQGESVLHDKKMKQCPVPQNYKPKPLKRFFIFERFWKQNSRNSILVSLRPVDFHVLFIRQVLCSVPLEGCISLGKFSQSIG